MATYDYAFGFAPWGNILRTNLYCVITAPTIAIYHNDVVRAGGVNTLTPHGYMMAIEDGSACDGNAGLLGSVQAIFDENMEPARYIAAAETGNGTIAGYVLVADSPDQLYVAVEDATGNAIDLAEGSMNANIATGASAGSTTTGLSKQMIDSDSAATTAALNVKILMPHPDDTSLVAVDSPTSRSCRYICQINEHYWGDTIAGL